MFDVILEASDNSKSGSFVFNKAKRKKIEDTVYEFFKLLEPTEVNYNYYHDMYSKMSDKEFEAYIRDLLEDEDQYIICHIADYEYTLDIKNINKSLNFLGIPLMEYVAKPYVNMDKDNPILSTSPVPVGYVHMKRMEQMRGKKNKGSTDISTRSALTGQVTAKDKNGRQVDIENYNEIVNGGEPIIKEFMSMRSDDVVMQSEALASIAEKGYVDINELTDKVENKTTLNVVDVYFIGMGLKTDLITKDLSLLNTLK